MVIDNRANRIFSNVIPTPDPRHSKRVAAALVATFAFVEIGNIGSLASAAEYTYTDGENDATAYILTEDSGFVTDVGGNITATQSGTIDLSTFVGTFDTIDATDLLTVTGTISGGGSIIKTGDGTLNVSGVNDFTGGVIFEEGIFDLSGSGVISGSARGFTIEGTALVINNSGLIEGLGGSNSSFNADAAIRIDAADGTVINNLFGATITGNAHGIVTQAGDVAVNTTINNDGTITGNNNDGIRLIGGGTVINSGTIEGLNDNPRGTDGVSAFLWDSSTPIDPLVGVGFVDNQSGGIITGLRFGVSFGPGGTVQNDGAISGGAAGVALRSSVGDPTTVALVTNSGTINQTSVDGSGISGLPDFTQAAGVSISQQTGAPDFTTAQIDNSGTISGVRKGVQVSANGVVVNNSGLIEGLGGSDWIIDPDAAIKIDVADGTVINNLFGGTISGFEHGIVTGAFDVTTNTTINNAGTIIGNNNDGVRLIGGGTVVNSGTIQGLIDDGSRGTDGVSIFLMDSSTPIDLLVGAGFVNNQLGASISGVRFGTNLGPGGTVQNDGIISGGAGGVALQSLVGYPATVALVTNTGTINQTSIDGTGISGLPDFTQAAAVQISQQTGEPDFTTAQIDNTGTISGVRKGVLVNANGVVINNSGLIEGLGEDYSNSNPDAAIKIDAADGTVINNMFGGTITGTTFGIVTAMLDVARNTTVNNDGTIIGVNNDGIRLIGGGAIINSGTIEGHDPLALGGSAGDGVSAFHWNLGIPFDPLIGSGFLDNQSSGVISGERHGVIFGPGGTVLNAGTITGGASGVLIQGLDPALIDQFAFVTNTGSIFATNTSDTGAVLSLANELDGSTVTNSGLLQGNFDGVRTFSSLTLVNTATGVIQSDLDGNFTGVAIRTAVAGEEAFGGPTQNFDDYIENNGTIHGDVILGLGTDTLINNGFIGSIVDLGAGNDSITNNGDIEGSLLLGDGDDSITNNGYIDGSLLLGDGDDTLVFVAGSTISGGVDGGDGEDEVVLEDNPDDPEAIVDGSMFEEFEDLSVMEGSTVDLVFSGENPFGSIEVIGSVLMLDHSVPLVSDILVGSGGTINFEGDGHPGFSIGTASVFGNVTFAEGSSFDVNISVNGAADQLNVSGSILIEGGTTVNVSTLQENPKFAGIKEYTLLTATDNISGSFTTITAPGKVIFPLLVHSPNEVILKVGKLGSIFSPSALSGNQSAIAGLLDGLDPSEGVGVDTMIEIFMTLASEKDRQALLDQMAGGGVTDLDNSSLSTTSGTNFSINSHLNEARRQGPADGASRCPAACIPGGYRSNSLSSFQSLQVQGAGGTSWFQSRVSMGAYGGSRGYMDPESAGGAMISLEGGFDTWIGSDILVGITYGISRTRGRALTDDTRGDAKYSHVGAYFAVNLPANFYNNTIFTQSSGDMENRREYEVGNFDFSPRAEVNNQTDSIYSEIGRDLSVLGFFVQPFSALQRTHVARDPFVEKGILDLAFDQDHLTSLHGSLGFRFNRDSATAQGLKIQPGGHFRFIHEFGSARLLRPTSVHVSGAGAQDATIFTHPGFENAFIAGGGLEISKGDRTRFSLDYNGFYSGEYRIHSMMARLAQSF